MKHLNEIINLSKFEKVFSELKLIDNKTTSEIETALKKATEETHKGIRSSFDSPDKLKYWLYRESVEVKSHMSSYLSYSEMMAVRESNLWKFALTVTEQFFDLIYNAFDEYFTAKKKIMVGEAEKESSWYSTITDSSKKILMPVNIAKKFIKNKSKGIGIKLNFDDKDIFNTTTVVEDILKKYLAVEQVGKDIAKILEEANIRVQEMWEKEIKSQNPDFTTVKAFVSVSDDKLKPTIKFELGAAEQTFAIGITGAFVGAVGLAAGWHTLTYAMLNVFPPIAIFSILATVGVAFFTKEKALEKRKKQVTEAVNKYHQHLILQIETYKLKELKDKTIRETLQDQSKELVKATVKKWQEIISGKLQMDHYRMILAATTAHLLLVENYLKENIQS